MALWSEATKLALDLEKAALKVQRQAPQLVAKHAQALEQLAKDLCETDTGRTRDSIGFDLTDAGMTAVIGPQTFWAPFLEWGTSKMAPRPFMNPAADEIEPAFGRDLDQLGGDVL